MLLRVLLVDDEPGALRFLSHIIASRCSGWEVSGTAENGRQALSAMETQLPDMVITDIRMPVMDGIGLAERIRRNWPGIRTLVISGYEDFGAAQNAMRNGVSDYLLKPVAPAQLILTMESAREALLEQKRQEAVVILAAAMAGERTAAERIRRCFRRNRFEVALVRTGALPSRYSERQPTGQRSLEVRRDAADCWLLAGRDERELLVFQTAGEGARPLEETARSALRFLPDGNPTFALCREPFALSSAPDVVQSLMCMTDHGLVLGKEQVLDNEQGPGAHKTSAPINSALEQRITGMVTGCAQTKELRELLEELCAVWRAEERPLFYVNRDIDKLLTAVERGLFSRYNPPADHEQQLEEIILFSADMAGLCERVWNLILGILRSAEKQDAPPGSEAFFEKVGEYIEQNISRQISLQSLCAAMGISQTYMSRIFRRHTGLSFSEYLTRQRIERAKSIMREQGDLPLKTVAELAGYKDPLYFSKVFRALEGAPPSRFAAQCNQDI